VKRIPLLLAVALVMVALVVTSAGTALAFSPAACNEGTMNAHDSIPNVLPSSNEETPGHEHVPECE